MKNIKFEKFRKNSKSNEQKKFEFKPKLKKNIKTNKDNCILCQKKVNINSMPVLIQKALSKKYNEYKLKEYITIIDDILEERYTMNFYDYIEINSYIDNENIFRKVFPAYKFKIKIVNLWKIYQFVIFIPRIFIKNFFKSISKYYNSIKKVRDKYLHDLISKMDEEEILKLKIDIRNIFKLKDKDIIEELENNNIKNKFWNSTLFDKKVMKRDKLSIKNILTNFKDFKPKNKEKDKNIHSSFLNDLKINFMNSISEILNYTLFNSKIFKKDYSELSFIKNNKETKMIENDVWIKRNFNKNKNKNKEKFKIKKNNDKIRNYSIKKKEIKKIKIINNINITNGNQYKNIIKDLKFPIKNIKTNRKIDSYAKTTTNRNIRKAGAHTNRVLTKKKKSIINKDKINKNDKKYKTLKSQSNLKTYTENKQTGPKFIKEKYSTKKYNSNNKYKINKSIGNKKLVLKSGDLNNFMIEKKFQNQYHTVKYKNFKNKFINSPIKISLNKENFNKIKKKITKNLFSDK